MAIPPAAAPQANNPQEGWLNWLGRLWHNPVGTVLVDGPANRAAELVQNNQGAAIRAIREVFNLAIVGHPATVTTAFERTRTAINQFLEEPTPQRAMPLEMLLTQVAPDRQEVIYQIAEISNEKQTQIRNLILYLQDNPPIAHAADGEGWEMVAETRAEFEAVASTFGEVIERLPGPIDRAGDRLAARMEGVLQQVEEVPQRIVDETLNPFIERAAGRMEGLLQRAEQVPQRIVDQTVNPLLERVELIPHRVIPQLFNPPVRAAQQAPNPAPAVVAPNPAPAPVEGEPAPAPAAEGEEQPEEDTILLETILERAGPILGQIAATVGQAFSTQAATSLANMMIFVFDKIRRHLEENNAENQHIIALIDPLRTRILTAQQNGSWNDLYTTLVECRLVLQQQQIYLHGFRLPLNSVKKSPSAIRILLNDLRQHREALHIPGPQIETAVTQGMIEQETLKLKTKTAAYAPIRFISTYILGLEESEATYASLVNIPANVSSNEWNNLFKNRFHALIDQSDRFLVTKWIAKAFYFFLSPLSSFYTNALISNGINAFESWKSAPRDPANPKELQLIHQVRNWLASLSASYDEAAATPVGQVTDLQQMLETAIKSPERNGGLTSSELYQAVSVAALDSFGPRFRWRQTLCQHYALQIPPSSIFQFLNPVLSGINLLCGWATHTALFVPEWIANQCLRLGTYLALKSHPFLENNLNKTLNSFRSNTQTAYAMHKILYNQLDRVWKLLETQIDPEDGEAPPPSNSTTRQVELAPLVQYLLEVLNKSRYGTQNRLSNYIAGRMSVRDRAEKELDDLFLPEALEQAVGTISLALDAVLNEESLNELLFNCLSVANSSMDADAPVSEEEFEGLETEICDLADRILEKSIFNAVEEKFDFTGEKQKKGVKLFTDKLKEQSTQTATSIREQIAQIDPNAAFSADGIRALRTALETSHTFEEERIAAETRAEGNAHFHGETKRKLGETSHQLATQYTPISTSLMQSLRCYEESTNLKAAENIFLEMQRSLEQIQNTAVPRGAQLQQLIQAQAPAQILVDLIARLKPFDGLVPTYQQLKDNSDQLRQAISRAETERRRLANLHPVADPAIHAAIILSMRNFYRAQEQIANLTQTLRDGITAEIQQATIRVANNRVALQNNITQLTEQITTFQTWTTEVHEIPIWNLPPIFDMGWVTDFTKDMACYRARQKVTELREALLRRHNFVGLFQQANLFFLETYG